MINRKMNVACINFYLVLILIRKRVISRARDFKRSNVLLRVNPYIFEWVYGLLSVNPYIFEWVYGLLRVTGFVTRNNVFIP